MSTSINKNREPIYFYITKKWYTGRMPNFHDVSAYKSTQILESNYEEIKAEILKFYDEHPDSFKPNFTPYKYKEEGWRTINLYAFMLQYPENIKKFPVINEVVKKVPNMVTAQIAVLNPHTRIKAHFGDSNVIVRNHLGIVIPGKYPDLGFRNGSQERCWEEGKVLSICISHRHYVWNNTDNKRIILLVDVIHPDFLDKQYYVCGGLLAAAALKLITSKFPKSKKAPDWIVIPFHKVLTVGFMFNLFLQNKLGIRLGAIFNKFKVDL